MKIIMVSKCELCPFLGIIRDIYRIDNEYVCTRRNLRFIVNNNIPYWCPLEDYKFIK